MKRIIYLLCAYIFLCGCSVKKRTISTVEQRTQTTTTHTSVQALSSFDSLLQTLDFSADSVIIELTSSAPDSIKAASSTGLPTPILKITAHQPRVHTTKQSHNLVIAQKAEQDSMATQNTINSHADMSNDTVGVATPMNGTLVVIIVLLAVLTITTAILLLFLHKYKII